MNRTGAHSHSVTVSGYPTRPPTVTRSLTLSQSLTPSARTRTHTRARIGASD